MLIPKRLKVGKRAYQIHLHRRLLHKRKGCMGVLYPTLGTMELATHRASGRAYPPHEMDESFWHELVHAVLYEMNSPLWLNEHFVTQFAHKLSRAVGSAEL